MGLGAVFSGMALWLAAEGDPLSGVLGLLAVICVAIGYAAVSGIKRRGVQAAPPIRPATAEAPPEKSQPS